MPCPRRSFVCFGPFALSLALFAQASTARAAEPATPRAAEPATAAPARETQPRPPAASSDENDAAAIAALREIPIVRKPWALFDPFYSQRESRVFGGPVSLRETDQAIAMHGATIGFGDTQRETRGPLWLSIERSFDLRLFSKWTMLFGLLGYSYQAGLRIGPIEFGAGPGLNVFGIDVSDGDWSVSGFSPRASARAGLKTGNFRVSLSAYRAYHFRWFGRASAYLTGFSLELALEAPPKTRFAGHPVVLKK